MSVINAAERVVRSLFPVGYGGKGFSAGAQSEVRYACIEP